MKLENTESNTIRLEDHKFISLSGFNDCNDNHRIRFFVFIDVGICLKVMKLFTYFLLLLSIPISGTVYNRIIEI